MATKRLIGKDGKLYTLSKDTELTTGALAEGYYVVTAVATSASGLPTGIEVGYPLYTPATSGHIITLGTGDKVRKLTLTEQCDLRSGSLEFTNEEIDVTTLCDSTKVYRAGFSEAQGSLEGITTIGISEVFINKFLPVVTQTSAGTTTTVSDVNGDPLLLLMEVNGASTIGEDVAMYFAPITMLSYNAGAQVEGEQAFTADFRITTDADLKACFFEIEQA